MGAYIGGLYRAYIQGPIYAYTYTHIGHMAIHIYAYSLVVGPIQRMHSTHTYAYTAHSACAYGRIGECTYRRIALGFAHHSEHTAHICKGLTLVVWL
jgi:hypothetical protein